VRAVVDAIAVMALIALLQFRLGWEPVDLLGKIPLLRANSDFGGFLSRSSFRRPAGTAGHPIEYGIIVSSGLAFSIHLLLHDPDRSRLRRWMPFSMIALGIPIAISRSALLVTLAVLVVFWLGEASAVRVRALAVIVVIGGFVFVTIPGLIGTLRGFVFAGNSDSSISTRTSDYAEAAPYLRRSPWVGRGPGTFLPRYFILDNQYLASLIEVGLIGTLALLVLLLSPYWFGRGARRRAVSESDRNLGQMFAAAGASAAVAASTYDLLSFGMFSALLFLYLGSAAGFRADLPIRSTSVGNLS
jgi:O-antigen ligase